MSDALLGIDAVPKLVKRKSFPALGLLPRDAKTPRGVEEYVVLYLVEALTDGGNIVDQRANGFDQEGKLLGRLIGWRGAKIVCHGNIVRVKSKLSKRGKKRTTHEELKARALQDEAVRAEYEALGFEFDLLHTLLEARQAANLT